jgi:uncharacterized protein YpuA (DUF1002 family)
MKVADLAKQYEVDKLTLTEKDVDKIIDLFEVDFTKIKEVMSDEEVVSLSETLDRLYGIVDNLDDMIRTIERFIKC